METRETIIRTNVRVEDMSSVFSISFLLWDLKWEIKELNYK